MFKAAAGRGNSYQDKKKQHLYQNLCAWVVNSEDSCVHRKLQSDLAYLPLRWAVWFVSLFGSEIEGALADGALEARNAIRRLSRHSSCSAEMGKSSERQSPDCRNETLRFLTWSERDFEVAVEGEITFKWLRTPNDIYDKVGDRHEYASRKSPIQFCISFPLIC